MRMKNEKLLHLDQQSTTSASASAAMAHPNQAYKTNPSSTSNQTPKKSNTQTRNLLDPAQFRMPDSQTKNGAEDEEERKEMQPASNQKGVTTITTGNTAQITNVVEPPDRKRKVGLMI